jgi:hypothetical protein
MMSITIPIALDAYTSDLLVVLGKTFHINMKENAHNGFHR